MPYAMILGIVAVAIAVAAVRYVRALFAPASSLGLSLFRPYRGDPWPRGVQEQYDVRFDWEPPAKRSADQEAVHRHRARCARTDGRRHHEVDVEDPSARPRRSRTSGARCIAPH